MTATHPNTATECPNEAELRALLSSDVQGERLLEMTEHVGECQGCQGRMERLATHEMPGLPAAIHDIDKQEIPEESALWSVLDAASSQLTHTVSADGPTIARFDADLKFLEPLDKPNRIGRIGEFEIISVVGRGGMGVVLQAYDPTLDRNVAIKILDPQLASNDIARTRFLREARAAAAVSHDNIVAVHSVNEDGHSTLPFFVMQLVAGESLEQRLKRVGKLSVAETVQIGAQAAAGLAAAHATGLIHRDIKPGNILIEAVTERVKLTDFGLARATEDMKLTRTGFVSGTPLYMAPEQAKGDEVDHRADLFSLGVVLYECLAGKPPFDGKTPLAVLRRVADDAHAPLHQLQPDLPVWFEDVIDRLLVKDPKRRTASALELCAELAAHGIPVKAANCEPGKTKVAEPCVLVAGTMTRRDLRRWKIRLAVMMAASFLLGALIASGVVLSATQFGKLVNPPSNYTVLPSPDALSDAAQDFPSKSGAVWSLAISPDGKTLLMGLEDGHILVYDTATEKVRQSLKEHRGPVFGMEFFPDGKQFVSVSDDGRILVWNLDDLRKPVAARESASGVRAIAVDRKGTRIATGDRSGEVTVWEMKDMMELKPTKTLDHGGSVHGLSFSTDEQGAMLATTGSNKITRVWDLATKTDKFQLVGHKGPVYSVAYSGDNELIATAGWDGSIKIWSADNYTELQSLTGHEYDVWSVTFSPCGKMLASAGSDGTVRIWDVKAGKEMRKYNAHKPVAHVVRFSSDCKMVFSGGRDGDVRAWLSGKP